MCIRHTFVQELLHLIWQCVLYTKQEIYGVSSPGHMEIGNQWGTITATLIRIEDLIFFHINCVSNMLAHLQWFSLSSMGKTISVLSSCRHQSEFFVLSGLSRRFYFKHTNYNTLHEFPSPYCL